MEQVEIMSAAIWQHTMTMIGVGGYVLGGAGGAERAGQVRGKAKTKAKHGPDLTHLWQPYFDQGLRWNLRDAPSITPEEDSRRKIAMLGRLVGRDGVARLLRSPSEPSEAAQDAGGGGADLDDVPVPVDAEDAAEAFLRQLRRADQIQRGEE